MNNFLGFAGVVPASKFCLVGGTLFDVLALQRKGSRFDSHRGAPVQHILLDIDDDEDDEHEEDHKDEDDEDDEDDEEDEEDDKG